MNLYLYYKVIQLCMQLLLLRVPPQTEADMWRNDPAFMREVGVLVPCHKSADEIGRTVESLVRSLDESHLTKPATVVLWVYNKAQMIADHPEFFERRDTRRRRRPTA